MENETPKLIYVDGVPGYEASFAVDINGVETLQVDTYCNVLGEIFYPELH